MRQVAAEMNLPETAFAYPLPETADADWALRWFTPTVEVDLCGHATLATAHALRSDNATTGTVRFSSRSGVLITHTHDDGTITLDFPSTPTTEVPLPRRRVETACTSPAMPSPSSTARSITPLGKPACPRLMPRDLVDEPGDIGDPVSESKQQPARTVQR
jgi:hypothetical protein